LCDNRENEALRKHRHVRARQRTRVHIFMYGYAARVYTRVLRAAHVLQSPEVFGGVASPRARARVLFPVRSFLCWPTRPQ
jgi:hypothetical protein